eukprot:m.109340 g.109340  ORF g.109340 m.109340 type:complete len:220 (-) comp15243_c0_seq1:383-1042(-)
MLPITRSLPTYQGQPKTLAERRGGRLVARIESPAKHIINDEDLSEETHTPESLDALFEAGVRLNLSLQCRQSANGIHIVDSDVRNDDLHFQEESQAAASQSRSQDESEVLTSLCELELDTCCRKTAQSAFPSEAALSSRALPPSCLPYPEDLVIPSSSTPSSYFPQQPVSWTHTDSETTAKERPMLSVTEYQTTPDRSVSSASKAIRPLHFECLALGTF